MSRYDFILAGGGVAGLSLAYHLVQSSLRDQSILIIDRDHTTCHGHTLSFWSSQPTVFDGAASRSWDRLKVIGEDFETTAELGPYRYNTIRGSEFYQRVQQTLAAYPNVELVQGTVTRIEDTAQHAVVLVDDQTPYEGEWVFDSRFTWSEFHPAHCRAFQQHFQGWEIETETDAFDPQVPIFMDFRAPQQGGLCFFYALPFSEREALVECVQMGQAQPAQNHLLKTYLEKVLGIGSYRIRAKEGGISPLTDWRFPRQAGPHTMAIGTQGGRVKPSSGYAFTRIQQDSAAIVRSLCKSGHPFDIPSDPRFYRLCDSLMLRVMGQREDWLKPLFLGLFKNNPIERILSFLDETSSPAQNLQLTASLVPQLVSLAVSRQSPAQWADHRI